MQLSLLSPSQMEQRDAAYKARKGKKNNNKNRNKNKKAQPKKEVSMDDAMTRLMERFGRN